jgi:hypothetical protein
MKRNEIVKSLLNEGFSEKTLVNFSDKQLNDLAVRIFSEETMNIPKEDLPAIEAAKKEKKSFVTFEEKEIDEELKGNQKNIDKNKNGKIDSEDFKLLKKNKKKENIKEWVSNVTNKNFHSFTSKNEIMEMIQFKLKEDVGSKVKKGHNGIPEFMTYDSISDVETMDNAPITKPAPTKPKESPITKPRTPYSPKPGEKSKPKALKEKEVKNAVK